MTFSQLLTVISTFFGDLKISNTGLMNNVAENHSSGIFGWIAPFMNMLFPGSTYFSPLLLLFVVIGFVFFGVYIIKKIKN